MLALAAARLGLKVHVFAQDASEPAFQVAGAQTLAAWDDQEALKRFAEGVSAVTYEFENVPVSVAEFLAAHVPVRPGAEALARTQDRLIEKTFLRGLGIATAPFSDIPSVARLQDALAESALPAILKTRRFGYDGKGQARVNDFAGARAVYESLGNHALILEGVVPFAREISVIGTRTIDGTFRAYDVCENQHANHILALTNVPANISRDTAGTAIGIARRIADALSYVGTLAVEMFVVEEAAGETLVVNEVAPRVHNSGHWTLDGAVISQFEQHIRAVAGWPLGSTKRHGRIEMRNVIGHDADGWEALAALPQTCLHLYGKAETRSGRKMGHLTTIFDED
jgi:5-(carboxyamino)imidazole ribonucleotide synthase